MTRPDLAIVYEHPDWFRPLFAALDRAGVAYAAIALRDHSFDPAGSPPQPYPQYFLYELMAGPTYLGLDSGGYMAKSISPATLGNGLVVTAFYTPNLDAVVLINPSQYTYTDMPVNITNSGLTSPVGTPTVPSLRRARKRVLLDFPASPGLRATPNPPARRPR